MRLGDLLIAEKLATAEQVQRALQRQLGSGGRLGEILVADGVLSADALDHFLHRVPAEPDSLAAVGVDEKLLLDLLLKHLQVSALDTVPAIAAALALPQHLAQNLVSLAITRRLLHSLGERERQLRYQLTEEGQRTALEALQRSQYLGPVPVTLESFTAMARVQRINHVLVGAAQIRDAFAGLTVSERFIEQIGPALNSGRALLLYGAPGNGKTVLAQRFAAIFDDIVYVPHAVLVGGQIMRVFDPIVHRPATVPALGGDARSVMRAEEADARWVACRRPFVVAGGELDLAMLDLQYDRQAQFYEAPLHVKAMGGCFMIDDFGRQLVAPAQLLNRWIVPMESRVDYLKLHTGKSFALPFESLLIFSTNLEPEDLMDPAFLRRLPYKLEVAAPTRSEFRQIFDRVCAAQNLVLDEASFDAIVQRITEVKQLPLAAYQPQFIIDQLIASCRFMQQAPHLEPRYLAYAIDNLRVNRH